MNIQLFDSLVEIVLKLSSKEQTLFQEKLSQKHLNLPNSKPLTTEEKLRLWQEWIDIAPKSYANLSDEALRRKNMYDDKL